MKAFTITVIAVVVLIKGICAFIDNTAQTPGNHITDRTAQIDRISK